MNRRHLLVTVILGAIVIGLAAWAIMGNMRPARTVLGPEDLLAKYQNDTYGFEVTYPKDLNPETSFRKYYALSDKWRSQAPEEQQGNAIVAIPVFRVDNPDGVATGKPYPIYFSAEVRVGASSDPQAVADCLKTDPGYTEQKHETVDLNGTQFERFEFGDAAMMQYVQGVSYRTVHNGTCFAMEQLKAGSTYKDESMTAGIPEEQLDVYYSQAGEMARTFRFTK
jgi:hypothetical protein